MVRHKLVEYNEFRTGFTFGEVREMLQHEANKRYARGEYMFITRATVLGRWHEIKQKMYYGLHVPQEISFTEENVF